MNLLTSFDLPIKGFTFSFFDSFLDEFSLGIVFVDHIVDPIFLRGEIIAIVSCDFVSGFDCFSGNTGHFSIVLAFIIDDLAVPVLGVVGKLGSVP